ncbi:hypothetical protein KUV73_25205 [Mameliella alba]|nr:hypothetical protein [Mameliella alba]MBY6170734.1 hypothetical protein [Mameliella alba]MBY6177674.1 hypothetical protein [Mameliella alba]
MQDPAFLAHKRYLKDVERAASPGGLRACRTEKTRDRRGLVKLVSVAALVFALVIILGVVPPWIA